MESKTQYIDNLYNLLIKYKFIGYKAEKENYRDSMYRLLFGSDGIKQKSIRSTLAEAGIILREDENLDTFLFYLSYYTFIKTSRDFLFHKKNSESPNRDLGYHIKKRDRNIWWIGIQFLLLYDTYVKATQEYENEEDIKEEFCRQILHSHQYIEDNELDEEEIKLLKECLKEGGSVYESAFINRDIGELELIAKIEREILVQLLPGQTVELEMRITKHFEAYFENAFSLKKNDGRGKWADEMDCIFFDLFYCCKLWKRTFELINLDYIKISNEREKELENVKLIFQSAKESLKEYFALYVKHMQQNNFLIVGSYFVIFEELREHNAQIGQLEILGKKISEGCVHSETKGSSWEYDFVEYDLDSVPVKDVLDYFIPDMEERKSSDRNEIKRRIKTLREALRYITICPDFRDIREIKMLYREFYIERNDLLSSKKYATILTELEKQDSDKIDPLDIVRLRELYIALKYLSSNMRQEYIQYNLQKQEYLKAFMKEVLIEPFGIPEK